MNDTKREWLATRPRPLKPVAREGFDAGPLLVDIVRSSGAFVAGVDGRCFFDARLEAPALGYCAPQIAAALVEGRFPFEERGTQLLSANLQKTIQEQVASDWGWTNARVSFGASIRNLLEEDDVGADALVIGGHAWGILPKLPLGPEPAADEVVFQGRAPLAIRISKEGIPAPTYALPHRLSLSLALMELAALRSVDPDEEERLLAIQSLASAINADERFELRFEGYRGELRSSEHDSLSLLNLLFLRGILADLAQDGETPGEDDAVVLNLSRGWRAREIEQLGLRILGTEVASSAPESSDVVIRVPDPSEAEDVLDRMMDLEARVYEPARRDPRDKLGLALRDPDGVAVIAEHRTEPENGERPLLGAVLATPLLNVTGLRGCDDDPLRELDESIYALSTTVAPEGRGMKIGRRMKAAAIQAAEAMQKPDGSPRYHFFVGRMRVGATGPMRHINRSLGAEEIMRFEGEYGGDAAAVYYRQPLRGYVPRGKHGIRRELPALDCEWPTQAPPSPFVERVESGEFASSVLHGSTPSYEMTLELRRLLELFPRFSEVVAFASVEDALLAAELSLTATEDDVEYALEMDFLRAGGTSFRDEQALDGVIFPAGNQVAFFLSRGPIEWDSRIRMAPAYAVLEGVASVFAARALEPRTVPLADWVEAAGFRVEDGEVLLDDGDLERLQELTRAAGFSLQAPGCSETVPLLPPLDLTSEQLSALTR